MVCVSLLSERLPHAALEAVDGYVADVRRSSHRRGADPRSESRAMPAQPRAVEHRPLRRNPATSGRPLTPRRCRLPRL